MYHLDWRPSHGTRSVGRPRCTLIRLLEDDAQYLLSEDCGLHSACRLAGGVSSPRSVNASRQTLDDPEFRVT